MKTWRQLGGAGALGLAVVAVTGIAPAAAGTNTAIDKPGAYCWQFGSTAPGATRNVLALDIDPSDHPTKLPLWWASGVGKATNADVATENYVDNLSGTITLAKPNERKPGPKLLQMGLVGTGYGTNAGSAETGVWSNEYTIQLNRKTLKGTITGVMTFTPVSGATAGTPAVLGLSEKIKPISCKKV